MLHSHLIKETGGCDGVRDISLLESALDATFSGFDGMEIYPSVQKKAARYAYGLVKNHAFIDGSELLTTCRSGGFMRIRVTIRPHIFS